MNSKNYNSESRGIARALRVTAAKTRLGFGALLRVCSLVILLGCLGVQGAWAQTGNWSDYKTDRFAGGTGTQADPYLVETAEQLAYFASSVTGGNTYAGKYVKLAADIDLGAHWWQPIGSLVYSDTKTFYGIFDGNMHVIKNMTISWTNNNSASEKFGLFSSLSGTVQNLVFENAHITATQNLTYERDDHKNMGILAGSMVGEAMMKNIVIRNSRIDDGNGTYVIKPNTTGSLNTNISVGGLVGYGSSDIKNKFSRAENVVVDVNIDFSHTVATKGDNSEKNSHNKATIGGVFGFVNYDYDNTTKDYFRNVAFVGSLNPAPQSALIKTSDKGNWLVKNYFNGGSATDAEKPNDFYEGDKDDVKDKFYFFGDVKEEHLPKDYGTNIHTFTLPVINAAGEPVDANTVFDWTLIGNPSEDPLAQNPIKQVITVYEGSEKWGWYGSMKLPASTFTDINLKVHDVIRIYMKTDILEEDEGQSKEWELKFYDGHGDGDNPDNSMNALGSVLGSNNGNILTESNYTLRGSNPKNGYIEIPVNAAIGEGLTSETWRSGFSLGLHGVDVQILRIDVIHDVEPYSLGDFVTVWEGKKPLGEWQFGVASDERDVFQKEGVTFKEGDSIRIWADFDHNYWHLTFLKDDYSNFNVKGLVERVESKEHKGDHMVWNDDYPLAFKQGYVAVRLNAEWVEALNNPVNNKYFILQGVGVTIKKVDVRKEDDPSAPNKEVAYQIYGVDTVRVMTDLFPKKGYKLEVYKKGTTPREQVYSASFTVSPEQWGEGHIHSTSLEGAGTSANPYKIKTAADLAYMIGRENDNKYYALENDVDLDHAWWNPMGIVTPFKGTLEGNGYAIYNMNVDWTANANSGFFSQLDGKVQNLIIDNAKLSALNDVPVSTVNVGVLAGSVAKTAAASIRNIVIRRSQITDLDTIAAADNKVVHHSIRGSVTNHTNMGGLVGVVNDGQKVDMRYIASQVNFELTKGDKYHDVGGIIGRNNHAKNANFVPSYLYFEGDASKATMANNRNTIYGYGGNQPDFRSDNRHGVINALTFSGQSTQQLDHDVISASHTEASTQESLLAWHYDTPLEGGYNGFKLLEVTSKYEVDDVEGPAGHLHRKTREFMTYDFTYTRDIAPGMWVPFISPVSFTAEQMEEQGLCVARLYDINFVINADHTNTDWIYIQLLQLHGDDATEPNVPYMVLRDEASTGHEYKGKIHLANAANGIKVADNKPYWQQCASVEYIFTFCGSFEPFAKGALYKAPGSDKVNYVLSATDGRWHRPSEKLALKANRFYVALERKSPEWCAYFDEEDEASAPAIRMRLVGEDEFTDEAITTAISEVEAADNNNIVRVSAAQIGLRPGLYVIEGKQVVVE